MFKFFAKPKPAPTLHDQVGDKIDAIEAKMKKLGLWQATPLDPKLYENMGAFGMNTMAFQQWLQFILIPNVRQIIAAKGRFPGDSQVAVWGARNFGAAESNLQSLLSEFDALFNKS